jgi:outer membrane biosynthesis protein TonB
VPALVAEAILAATARGASLAATTREIAVAVAWDATHSDDQTMPADLVQLERARREQTEAASSPGPTPAQERVADPAPTPAQRNDAAPETDPAQPSQRPAEPTPVQQPDPTPVQAPTPTPAPGPVVNTTPAPTPVIAPEAQPEQVANPVAVPADETQDEDDAGTESDRPRRNRTERPPISF